MNSKTSVLAKTYRLFNPYHDRVGRFTSSARNVTGKAGAAAGRAYEKTRGARRVGRTAAAILGTAPQAQVGKVVVRLTVKSFKQRARFAKWCGGTAFKTAKFGANTAWRASQFSGRAGAKVRKGVAKSTLRGAGVIGKVATRGLKATPAYKAGKKAWEK